MKKIIIAAAALFAITASAHAETYNVEGVTIHVGNGCRSSSCVSVYAPGYGYYHGERSSARVHKAHKDTARVAAMAQGLRDVAALPDPLARTLAEWTRPNGLVISRIAQPIGVIGMIYESRPNVGADAAALAIKSGNAILLRGGSESFRTAQAIHRAMTAGLREAGSGQLAGYAIRRFFRIAPIYYIATCAGLIGVIVADDHDAPGS